MATITLTASKTSQSCTSTWTGTEDGYGTIRYSTPTVAGATITFTAPSVLTGATINSVTLSYNIAYQSSSDKGTKLIKFASDWSDYTDSKLVTKLRNGATSIDVSFRWRANGGTGGEGTHSLYASYSNIAITVDYTPAALINGTITMSSGATVAYYINQPTMAAGETTRIGLTITPNSAANKIKIAIDDSNHTNYTETEYSIIAPASTSTNVEVDFTLVASNLVNRYGAGYIKVTLYESGGTVSSDWTAVSGLKVVKTRNAPVVSASITDIASYYTTFAAYVQAKSSLRFTMSATLDTAVDSNIAITNRVLTLTDTGGNVSTFSASSNTLDIGTIDVAGTYTWQLSITDTYNVTGTASGTITIAEYAAPYLNVGLAVNRYSAQQGASSIEYVLDDNSPLVWVDATGAVTALNGHNAWTMTAVCTNGSSTINVNMTSGSDGATLSYNNDRSLIPNQLSENSDWTVTITLADSISSVSYEVPVPKSGGIFSIEKGGVAVGQRCTGTENAPLFQCAYRAQFSNTVQFAGTNGWVELGLGSNVNPASSLGHYLGARYRVDNGKVRVEASVQYTQGSNTQLALALPSQYLPEHNIYGFFPLSGDRIARCFLNGNGLFCEWVYNLNGTSKYTGSVSWIDIVFEYYISETQT